ncbi:MAG: ribonuclease PH [Pirellulales bacterium]
MIRHDGRGPDELRRMKLQRHFTRTAPGSVLVEAGGTIVLCTASLAAEVPPWRKGQGSGWLTAEYSMLPGSTLPRKPRERSKMDGRTTEIQRLIGRSLRAVVQLDQLGERTLMVDCDVLQADGGTRTASINGAWVACVDALVVAGLDPRQVLSDSVAAISVGVSGGRVLADLDYSEDVSAAVDMNVVMTGLGRYVEVQGTGEEATFSDEELAALLHSAKQAIQRVTAIQCETLGGLWG